MTVTQATIGPLRLKFSQNALWIDHDEDENLPLRLDFDHFDELTEFIIQLRDNSANRRQVYRVPLWKTCGLSVKLKVGDTIYDCNPRNISLTGVFIELPNDALLAPGVQVEVALQLDEIAAVFDGKVVRVKEGHCGIIFPEAVASDQFTPPEALADMVMELQRRLMKRAWS
ncbi:MAG: PilZ domain-containing protein [bacterium]|nr:PilZ domain-containing protein [bacterium]